MDAAFCKINLKNNHTSPHKPPLQLRRKRTSTLPPKQLLQALVDHKPVFAQAGPVQPNKLPHKLAQDEIPAKHFGSPSLAKVGVPPRNRPHKHHTSWCTSARTSWIQFGEFGVMVVSLKRAPHKLCTSCLHKQLHELSAQAAHKLAQALGYTSCACAGSFC